ncbi:hypothetical protein A1A1_02315 [Planococcus antarcticus DSM 14505]|uniref:Uncharacterized protein n=1 Tax=Planococcus antarcticus DSM 14505 TaxID=1185653 RepID=A0A1C7DJH4_9BACL|nr:hypothetical protein [Planococcus antarcticus]ANU11574.1 hypothetical protein BBH88_15470 [Planococcus antarcticus DSM 14505]EIM08121.1 hypothetical protein A1A1_02315 [Planococcus antarcticus DSM 14505]
MGFWYFLITLIGLFLVFEALFKKKRFSPPVRIGIIFVGFIFLAFSLFMFSPGSDEIIADLLDLS